MPNLEIRSAQGRFREFGSRVVVSSEYVVGGVQNFRSLARGPVLAEATAEPAGTTAWDYGREQTRINMNRRSTSAGGFCRQQVRACVCVCVCFGSFSEIGSKEWQ